MSWFIMIVSVSQGKVLYQTKVQLRVTFGACWRKVVEAKYGSGRGEWRSKVRVGSHGKGLWKFISKE
jgi:hypothetical protein